MTSTENLRDEISRLETRIEDLSDSIERCRKLDLFSKLAMSAGGLLLLAIILGLLTYDPMFLIGAIAAIIGGIVFFGSNTATLNQLAAERNAAEAERAELIGMIDLQLVPGNVTLH
jgi:hypothetical protein